MNRIMICLFLLICLPAYPTKRTIDWKSTSPVPASYNTFSGEYGPSLFQGSPPAGDRLAEPPVYYELLFAPDYYPDHEIELTEMRFAPLSDNDRYLAEIAGTPGSEISIQQEWVKSRGQSLLQISFVPLRRNPINGETEKLISFTYNFIRSESIKLRRPAPKSLSSGSSVLGSGKWVKIKTTEDGIYRLTYDDLVEMGIQDPANVRIYGNGNMMLGKMNDQPHENDINEKRIYMSTGSDGIFNRGDYILFYGQGPIGWNYNYETEMFEHERHLYADGCYYFVTSSASGKERIGLKNTPDGTVNGFIDSFDDYDLHEQELVNLLHSGRDWYGEHFKIVTSAGFSFGFPGIVSGSQGKIKWKAASRSPVSTQFTLSNNSSVINQLNFTPVNLGSIVSDYAVLREGHASFSTTGDNIQFTVDYVQNTPSSEGWLDYIIVNVRRSLLMSGNQMQFRDIVSSGENQVRQFRLGNASAGIRVWDITNIHEVSELSTDFSSNTLIFNDLTGQLNQYIAFTPGNYLEPEVIGEVPNQNLNGINGVDMIIISHPLFMNQANQLANHRRNVDGLEVVIVNPEQIYNEFSSGKPDISAIRNFVKTVYKKAEGQPDMLRYLLLFGKGSYDNRPGDPSGINFIPTYQSANSLRPTQSFVSDDFFGLLDDDEGEYSGLVDIGIGRLPVATPEQAQTLVNKIINYNTPDKKGDWQNILCFIADDGDNNIHMRDADILAEGIKEAYPSFNKEKIYLDAWPKIGTSLGQRYPEVNLAISERIRKGALIMNYTGHGNELRLADENIIDINDVLSWTNSDRLPLFMTATCEFSRFDNPERVSAGEMLLLNPGGGSIAMFSTTRLVYATPNFFLNQNFYRFILEKVINDREMRLGDVMRLTKINSGSGINKRNFTLLGDPSMKLALPAHRVVITSVNQTPVNEIPDTLMALSKVDITGTVEDRQGNIMNDFSGVVYQTVYDKESIITTLGNDGSTPFNFTGRTNIIYKGKASVTGGKFSFSFIVPKDIGYHFGNGKISSFAENGQSDAAGYLSNIIIGGSDPDAVSDTRGPEIELFMNDHNFVSGGITNQDPRLLARLTDSSGINTLGSGIGHDITLVMNRDPGNILVLNDYYVADTDSYQSGSIEYPFSGLKEGSHNLNLKAWDVHNNSSEAFLEFTVSRSAKLALDHVFNYPNPFTQNTAFHFEHNYPDSGLEVLIQIFTISGKLVKTMNTYINTTGFKPDPIPWDGLDEYGDRIGRGVYIYRIRLRTDDGEIAEKYEKLVILK
ncbi:MAG: type IX secretion system sortase PorU [Bacteroidales bacterium]